MGRRGQSVTLSISDSDKAQLEQIALEQGMTWGDRPNLSRLVEAIARRELLIGRNNDWSEAQIRALYQAVQLLTDTGKTEEARLIARLLIERSELSIPLRFAIERFLETPVASWRLEIDQYIRRQMPFRLTYLDAADRSLSFTIRHAKVVPRDRREYLECWCEETDGNTDLPALQHNWSLRLDRIPDAAIAPMETKWRPNLDYLSVELHLFNGLSFAYAAKPNDTVNEWIPDQPQVRRVVRQVSSTFWFFREILPYAEDCVIVSPPEVGDQFRNKLQVLYERYNNNA
jgi:predicted DNA-binding transcriptional regulator YafY